MEKQKTKVSKAYFIVYKRVMDTIFDIEKTSQNSFNKFFELFYNYIGRNYYKIDFESDLLEIDEPNDELTKEVLNCMLSEIMKRLNESVNENAGLLDEMKELVEENEILMSEIKSLKLLINSSK